MSEEINTNKINSTESDVDAHSENNQSISDLLVEIQEVIEEKTSSTAKIDAIEEKEMKGEEKKYISIGNLTLQQITICQENHHFHQQENKEHTNKFFGTNLDKMLFRFACSYLLGLVLWVVANEQFKFILVNQQKEATIAENVKTASDDSQFIEYMAATLKAIDYQQQQAKAGESVSSPTPPQLTESEDQNSSNSVIMPTTRKLPVTSPSLSLASAIANLNHSITPPPPLYLSNVKPTVPGTENIPQSPSFNHNLQLVGLLASGDRSVALFTINETTHRIKLGEKIGSTGWTLTSITEQQAIINRNGELLYMAVGEKF